jgi:hypothetical protein
MKRRTKANDESWVDLIQAGNNQSGNPKCDTRNSTCKDGRRKIAVALGLIFLMVMQFSAKRKDTTTTTISKKQSKLDSFGGGKRRNRKVVLLGPHDRYHDFGDILAERIVTKLLVDQAGFVYDAADDRTNTLLLGGIVTRDDMDRHGLTPHKTVHSMGAIQTMSRQDLKNGPYDIVFTGGSGDGPNDEGPSILYEKHKDAVVLLESEALRKSALADRVYDCPYLFPKELLHRRIEIIPGLTKKHKAGFTTTLPQPKKNYAIIDSLETPPFKKNKNDDKQPKEPPLACRRVAIMADHMGFRGIEPFAPDSSVMTKDLFEEEIETIFETQVKQELLNLVAFSSSVTTAKDDSTPIQYIAVQHETEKHITDANYAQELADALDEVSKNLGNVPIVFFPAGRVGRPLGDHVAFGLSREVVQIMQQPSVLYEAEHAMKVAALISGAKAVVSTNLHVHILSFVYQKPRAMLHGGQNHQSFMDMWEAGDVASLGIVSNVHDTWNQGLQRFFVESGSDKPLITQKQTKEASQKAIRHYLQNFVSWSNLLTTPTEKGDDDDDAV